MNWKREFGQTVSSPLLRIPYTVYYWLWYDLPIGDSPERMTGLPVSAQIVGRRLSEEYLLGVGKIIDDSLKVLH